MKRAVLVVACVIGICAGVLICLLFQHVLQAETGAKGNGFGAAAEWKALSIQERTSYVEGYVVGYGVGSSDVCEDADRLFATAGPVYLKDGTLNNPVTICKASLDHFTRMGKRGEVRPNYSVYSDVITDFYNKYPKYSNMPFSFLLAMLSDKNFKTADQLFQKLERHDMQLTY
jgi:hypothetical protein